MQNGFSNKDLVTVQVLVSDFLVKTDLYKYIPTVMNERMEYIIIEFGFCARFVFFVYFYLAYLVFFLYCFCNLIESIAMFLDDFIGY